MRNYWLTAIAGHQGNVLTNISREGPTGAEGAGGPQGLAAGHVGRPRRGPAPQPGLAPRQPVGPQATTRATQQHVVSYSPGCAVPGALRRPPTPRTPSDYFAW